MEFPGVLLRLLGPAGPALTPPGRQDSVELSSWVHDILRPAPHKLKRAIRHLWAWV